MNEKTSYEKFIEDLVIEIMDDIYFDDINETIMTLEWFEQNSPMYEIKKKEIIQIVKDKFKDKTVINGKPLN